MEKELLAWLGRRWLLRPWVLLTWLTLIGVGLVLPRVGALSIRTEPLSHQALITELLFAWGLVGGLLGLGALAEISDRLQLVPALRRWRLRGFVFLVLVLAPAVPFLGLAASFSMESGGAGGFWVYVGVLLHLVAIALATEQIPWAPLRSIAFLSLAWWLPSLADTWPLGPGRFVEANRLPDSARTITWFGSIIPFILVALALDLVRRPQHEVRHPR